VAKQAFPVPRLTQLGFIARAVAADRFDAVLAKLK
jgi:hypothetical protein